MLSVVYMERSRTYITEPVFMYDSNVRLRINNAPTDPYIVELANGQKLPVENDVVLIPDEQFTSKGNVEMYIVVIDGKAVNTLCKIVVPVTWRPARDSVSTDNVMDTGG